MESIGQLIYISRYKRIWTEIQADWPHFGLNSRLKKMIILKLTTFYLSVYYIVTRSWNVCIISGASVADGHGEGANLQADELPEAFIGGKHARRSKREAATQSDCPSLVLRAATPAYFNLRLVLRLRQFG